VGRRQFLTAAAAVGGGASVLAATAGVASEDNEDLQQTPEQKKQLGYHETDHIRAYYKTLSA
jgi:Spy/CpxP family protein refolding chaperone